MFFNILLFLSIISSSRNRLFREILNKLKNDIDSEDLKTALKNSNVGNINNSEAYLMLTSILYCKAIYKKIDITDKEVFSMVKSSPLSWQLVFLSEKMINLDIHKFFDQQTVKKFNLEKENSHLVSKINLLKIELSKIRRFKGTDYPKKNIVQAQETVRC